MSDNVLFGHPLRCPYSQGANIKASIKSLVLTRDIINLIIILFKINNNLIFFNTPTRDPEHGPPRHRVHHPGGRGRGLVAAVLQVAGEAGSALGGGHEAAGEQDVLQDRGA